MCVCDGYGKAHPGRVLRVCWGARIPLRQCVSAELRPASL